MRETLIKISKVILTLVKIGSIITILAVIFLGLLKELPATNNKVSFLLFALVSIIYSIFYYLIANNVIYIINISKENPFVLGNVKKFDKTGIKYHVKKLHNLTKDNIMRLNNKFILY
ncbi:hypothetical protein [Metaclostridioides mangenotii]|uniref:hypothetical protein n=1 Tax=Metaclostridioides mangenotii TaxID=1540 RepID=UPI00047FBD6A|nr:hypothetical protein [Clostridioides mangenotii]